ncbi:inovirus Gp2 family protein [Providencia rettgeri]|nr:inovirus Gp2 family protein [Providencia rettgeri]
MMKNKIQSINAHYKDKIKMQFDNALKQFNRLFIIRLDLRFPKEMKYKDDDRVITRFFESLKAKLKAREELYRKQNKRIYPHGLRYAWVREIGPKNKRRHYHVILIFNKDAYFTLGNFNSENINLSSCVIGAWKSALGLMNEINGLVHFCPINVQLSYLDKQHSHFEDKYDTWMGLIDYLAKDYSKCYGRYSRSFGCSR